MTVTLTSEWTVPTDNTVEIKLTIPSYSRIKDVTLHLETTEKSIPLFPLTRLVWTARDQELHCWDRATSYVLQKILEPAEEWQKTVEEHQRWSLECHGQFDAYHLTKNPQFLLDAYPVTISIQFLFGFHHSITAAAVSLAVEQLPREDPTSLCDWCETQYFHFGGQGQLTVERKQERGYELKCIFLCLPVHGSIVMTSEHHHETRPHAEVKGWYMFPIDRQSPEYTFEYNCYTELDRDITVVTTYAVH